MFDTKISFFQSAVLTKKIRLFFCRFWLLYFLKMSQTDECCANISESDECIAKTSESDGSFEERERIKTDDELGMQRKEYIQMRLAEVWTFV